MSLSGNLVLRGAALETCLGHDGQGVAQRIFKQETHYVQVPQELTAKPSHLKGSPLYPQRLSCREAAITVISKALDQAGLLAQQRQKCGLIIGTISEESHLYEQEYLRLYRQNPQGEMQRFSERGPGKLCSDLKRHFGLGGPCLTINTACTSSANALAQASLLLRSGLVNNMIVLGIDTYNALTLQGFKALMLLDAEGCRPYDAERAGLQIGEGAAALVLARMEDGAGLWNVEICAPYAYNTAHHPTAMDIEGVAARTIVEKNLRQHNIAKPLIVAIKGHGTGTGDGDSGEVTGMRNVFGTTLPPMTSLKRYLGHTMGAVGTVETLVYLHCLEQGFVPACLGFKVPDPLLNYSPLMEHLPAPRGYHLLNFFGFGSTMVSVLIKWQP